MMNHKLYPIIRKLEGIPLVGNKIRNMVIRHEGGEITSEYARWFSDHVSGVFIDRFTYGGCFEKGFNNGGRIKIGRYCSFAQNIKYFGANHPFENVSQSAIFYNKCFGLDVKDVPRNELVVGNDVWIGYGVSITANCHNIGNGAVVGAGSVVTKDVPAYAIVAGNPAKIIRMRFSSEIVEELEKTKWWEIDPNEIMKYYDLFNNPTVFCRQLLNNVKGESDSV